MRQPDDEYLMNCRGVINDTTKRPILFMCGCKYYIVADIIIIVVVPLCLN